MRLGRGGADRGLDILPAERVEHLDEVRLRRFFVRLSEFRIRLVELPGRVSNEFLFAALQTMDLGVSSDPINPYNHHCTMNKVLEYMAFAKPQVMFDLKEGRFSAGDAACYVPENSAAALGQAIVKTLDDPGECERMGRLGHAPFHTQLNWEKSVKQLEAAYARALG